MKESKNNDIVELHTHLNLHSPAYALTWDGAPDHHVFICSCGKMLIETHDKRRFLLVNYDCHLDTETMNAIKAHPIYKRFKRAHDPTVYVDDTRSHCKITKCDASLYAHHTIAHT